MAQIKIGVSAVQDAASRIASCASKQADVLSRLQKAVNDLKNGWEGKAKDAFVAEYDKARPTYDKFAEDIKKFSDFLKQYVADMQKGDARGAQTMG